MKLFNGLFQIALSLIKIMKTNVQIQKKNQLRPWTSLIF